MSGDSRSVNAFGVGLRRVFGANNPADVKPARLEESLRLAYGLASFQGTRLWASIVAWEVENPPYVIVDRPR